MDVDTKEKWWANDLNKGDLKFYDLMLQDLNKHLQKEIKSVKSKLQLEND